MKAETPERDRFENLLDRLLKVPHATIKAALDKEKRAKARKKRAKASSASRATVSV